MVVLYPDLEVACDEGAFNDDRVGVIHWDILMCCGIVGWASGYCVVLDGPKVGVGCVFRAHLEKDICPVPLDQ